MSLVNQMLQDLQQRRATGSEPLTGLHAVPAAQPAVDTVRSKRTLIAVLAIVVVGVAGRVWLRPDIKAADQQVQVSAAEVESEGEPVAPSPLAVSEPDQVVARARSGGAYTLQTYRLDYDLRSPPKQRLYVAAQVEGRPAETGKPIRPDADTPTDVVPDGTTEIMIRTPVSVSERLRREGLAALRANKPIAAEQNFQKLVAEDPENPESHLFLHAALKAQLRTGAARAALLSGLEQTSDPAQLAEVLAHDLLADGRINHALAILTENRPADRVNLDYEARLAAVNQRAGNHDAAVDLYRQLLEHQPANGAWWVGLAISQEAQGYSNDARKSFSAATAAGTLDMTLARYARDRLDKLEAGS